VWLELLWLLPVITVINEERHLHKASPSGEMERVLHPLSPVRTIGISGVGRSLELDTALVLVHPRAKHPSYLLVIDTLRAGMSTALRSSKRILVWFHHQCLYRSRIS
jgi:hypothetical protein